jgi:hypothetical protein
MVALTGFVALGTGISNLGVFQEATTYTRPALALTGTVLSGLTQALAQITGPTGPVGGTITKGAIFDSLTGGNMLCYWDWTLLTAVPANFLAITLNVTFNTYLQTALNLALLGGQGTSGSLIDAGAQLGTMNGQPLLAGCRMNIAPGGNLTPHFGSGQWIGNADVQGTLTVGALAAGVNNGIVALAGGANSALTPTLTGGYNRITTCATSLDSVILPSLVNAQVGSILFVTNSGAAAAKVLPDTGSTVNALTSLVVGPGTSCLIMRPGSLLWASLPLLPS